MTSDLPISPTNLRDYAKSQGWVVNPVATRDRLYVLSNPRYDRRQIVFPMDTSAPDFAEAVSIALEKLAAFESESINNLIMKVESVNEDLLRFRLLSDDMRSLPFLFAERAIHGVQQLILSAACSVRKPRRHHPRLRNAEAQDLMEHARFQHTQPGSFVLTVAWPISTFDAYLSSTPDNTSFNRQTTITVLRSVRRIVQAIEDDQVSTLVAAQELEGPLIVSSNFCEALTEFFDDSLDNSLEIGCTFAALLPGPADLVSMSPVRVQPDYFPVIAKVADQLRLSIQTVEDTFIGTVERLEGQMGEDGERFGDIILSLLLHDSGEVALARASLNAAQYRDADFAHMHDGYYVKVTGRLFPGRQPRALELKEFALIPPGPRPLTLDGRN